jgi:hypothetical protein
MRSGKGEGGQIWMTSALTFWCCTYRCIASDASKTAAIVPAELDIVSNTFDNAIWSGLVFAEAQGQGEKGREQLQHARRAPQIWIRVESRLGRR